MPLDAFGDPLTVVGWLEPLSDPVPGVGLYDFELYEGDLVLSPDATGDPLVAVGLYDLELYEGVFVVLPELIGDSLAVVG